MTRSEEIDPSGASLRELYSKAELRKVVLEKALLAENAAYRSGRFAQLAWRTRRGMIQDLVDKFSTTVAIDTFYPEPGMRSSSSYSLQAIKDMTSNFARRLAPSRLLSSSHGSGSGSPRARMGTELRSWIVEVDVGTERRTMSLTISPETVALCDGKAKGNPLIRTCPTVNLGGWGIEREGVRVLWADETSMLLFTSQSEPIVKHLEDCLNAGMLTARRLLEATPASPARASTSSGSSSKWADNRGGMTSVTSSGNVLVAARSDRKSAPQTPVKALINSSPKGASKSATPTVFRESLVKSPETKARTSAPAAASHVVFTSANNSTSPVSSSSSTSVSEPAPTSTPTTPAPSSASTPITADTSASTAAATPSSLVDQVILEDAAPRRSSSVDIDDVVLGRMLAQATNENALLFHERDVLVRQNSDLVGENEHLKATAEALSTQNQSLEERVRMLESRLGQLSEADRQLMTSLSMSLTTPSSSSL